MENLEANRERIGKKEEKSEWLSWFWLRVVVIAGIIIVPGVESGYGKAKRKSTGKAYQSVRDAVGSSGQNRMTNIKGGETSNE